MPLGQSFWTAWVVLQGKLASGRVLSKHWVFAMFFPGRSSCSCLTDTWDPERKEKGSGFLPFLLELGSVVVVGLWQL